MKNDTNVRGLILNGTVVERSRKLVGEDGKTKELVTYKVAVPNDYLYVKHWVQNGNYHAVGEVLDVCIRVSARTYKDKTMLDFTIADENHSGFGEAF